jgi:ankyrin repeat protein
MHACFNRLRRSPILCLAAVALVVLAWSSLAFCGEIHDAAGAGDVGKIKALLKKNPELVFSKDSIGWTPLHYAAYSGQKGAAELLLTSNADVNAKDKNGHTPLAWATHKDHKDVAELLRRHGGRE